MRLACLLALLVGLVGLTVALPQSPAPAPVPVHDVQDSRDDSTASNSTLAIELYSPDPPGPYSVAAHYEGLAGCYAWCMIDQNKYFHTNLAFFTFKEYCGFYWKATQSWEGMRVRGCALHHCMDHVCQVKSKDCDVPKWIYQARAKWLIEHCKEFRPEVEDVIPLSGENYIPGPD